MADGGRHAAPAERHGRPAGRCAGSGANDGGDPATAGPRASTAAWEALFRAQVGVMRRMQRLPEFRELPMREYDVLFNLSRCPSGESRLSDLNRHLLISQPSLSRMAERLEARGLVARRPDPSDQRAVIVALTDEGRALQRRVGREHVRSIHELIGDAMSPEEFAELERLSRRISAALGD